MQWSGLQTLWCSPSCEWSEGGANKSMRNEGVFAATACSKGLAEFLMSAPGDAQGQKL
jgi:hypothetical protein